MSTLREIGVNVAESAKRDLKDKPEDYAAWVRTCRFSKFTIYVLGIVFTLIVLTTTAGIFFKLSMYFILMVLAAILVILNSALDEHRKTKTG
jgi:hypothetical protein